MAQYEMLKQRKAAIEAVLKRTHDTIQELLLKSETQELSPAELAHLTTLTWRGKILVGMMDHLGTLAQTLANKIRRENGPIDPSTLVVPDVWPPTGHKDEL